MNFVKVLNTKTRQIRDLGKSEKSVKAQEKMCIFVQMVCKDASLIFTNDFIRVNIIQEQGVPGFFPNISADDLLSKKKGSDSLVRLLNCLQTLLRFNVHIEANLCLTDQYQMGMTSLGQTNQQTNTDSKGAASAAKYLVISSETKMKDFGVAGANWINRVVENVILVLILISDDSK